MAWSRQRRSRLWLRLVVTRSATRILVAEAPPPVPGAVASMRRLDFHAPDLSNSFCGSLRIRHPEALRDFEVQKHFPDGLKMECQAASDAEELSCAKPESLRAQSIG